MERSGDTVKLCTGLAGTGVAPGFPRLAHLVALLLVTLAPRPAAPALSLDEVGAPVDADATRAIVHFHERVDAEALRDATLLYAFAGIPTSTSACGYRTPDGLRAGVGRCEGLIEKQD